MGVILNSSEGEDELRRRVEWVECVWAEAGDRLAVRQAQLQFEKAQLVSVCVQLQVVIHCMTVGKEHEMNGRIHNSHTTIMYSVAGLPMYV